MNKKLIVVLMICLIALLGASVGVTYAWLTSTGSDTIEYTVGDVSYTITGEVDDSIGWRKAIKYALSENPIEEGQDGQIDWFRM